MNAITGVSPDVERELRAICGEEYVFQPPAPSSAINLNFGRTSVTASDGSKTPLPPDPIFIAPGSVEEISAILDLANQRRFTVAPIGAPTKYWWPRPAVEVALVVCRLNKVEHYDHADLTVGVGAGITVAQLNSLVAADNLMFACDPPLPEHTTIGAVLAAAMHGPMRHGYGAVRDFCIGIRFVTGDGRKAKGGGRVVKNVAGYDLMKLLIGSYGTLAVITAASFKLFPAPRQTRTFIAQFATWQEALKFSDVVVRSPLSPMCLELVSPGARKLMRPDTMDEGWVVCVRASGSDAVLARYRRELGESVTREVGGPSETDLWNTIAGFPYSFIAKSAPADVTVPRSETSRPIEVAQGFEEWVNALGTLLVQPAHVSVPRSEISRAIEVAQGFASEDVIGCAFVGRVALGHLSIYTWPIDPEAFWSPRQLPQKLQEALGNAVTIRVESCNIVWPVAPASLASMRAVKQALDPNNVLRGREVF